jgi:hypothetical protein
MKGDRRITFYQNGEVSSIEGYYRPDVEKILEAVRARDSWRARHNQVPAQKPAVTDWDMIDDER